MQKILKNKEGDLSELPDTLPNTDNFARNRPYLLYIDKSLFIAAQEGSLQAHHTLVDMFLNCIRHKAIIPPGVLEYAICTLGHQAGLYRAEFKSWKHNQIGRKSAAGRPSPKALGDIRAQSLEVLSNSLQFNPVDTELNRDALQLVGDLNEKLKKKLDEHKKAGKRLPRAFPGSHRNHAQAYENAMNVWEYLKSGSTLIENTAIRWVAEDHHGWRGEDRGGQTPPGESRQTGDRRGNAISGLARTIDRHFYLIKPDLKKGDFPPLEFVLDD